jgi:hypothetical protein
MIPKLLFQHFRFHLDPKAPLHMPAYNKGNVIRGGLAARFGGSFVMGIDKRVFVIVLGDDDMGGS